MRFRRSQLPLEVRMDLTPLIDIVFLLLIFFMLTSSFVFQKGVKVHLPQAVTADVAHRESWVITVEEGGLLYLNSQIVTLSELKEKLSAAAAEKPPLLIQADRSSALGRVVEVWDLCRSVGLSEVNIATQTSSRTK